MCIVHTPYEVQCLVSVKTVRFGVSGYFAPRDWRQFEKALSIEFEKGVQEGQQPRDQAGLLRYGVWNTNPVPLHLRLKGLVGSPHILHVQQDLD